MRVSLAYDRGSIEIDLAGRSACAVAGDRFPPPLADPAGELRTAIDRPVGSRSLAAMISPKGTVSILVSDLTRGSAAPSLLPPLLEYLEARGAGPDRVTVVLATGTHRAHDGAELAAHLGGVLSRWPIIQHDSSDGQALEEVGTTAAGTRCLLRASVVRSSLVIALGTVSFHYFAGFGGARKLILPGVAGDETILANHRLSLRADPADGLAKGCRPGALEGNPVHEDMLAGARLLPARVFAVNVVPDDRGRIVFVNAGGLDESHRAACAFCGEHFSVPIDRLYQVVILSAGGWPKDVNLLQSHKALRNGSYALVEGGLMLAAAACPDGVGSPSYLAAFEQGRHELPNVVRRRYTLNTQTAVSTYELGGRLSIYLRSILDDSEIARFGLCPWKDDHTPYLLHGISDDDILILHNASMFLPVPTAAAIAASR